MSEPHKTKTMTQRKTGALDRAVRFINELSSRTLTRTEMTRLAKEFGVRNGLERFALERKWCKALPGVQEPNKKGRVSGRLKFIDLSNISPLHVRLLLDDANAYVMRSITKEKKTAETSDEVVTAEFEWTAETTKMFAKVYSGN